MGEGSFDDGTSDMTCGSKNLQKRSFQLSITLSNGEVANSRPTLAAWADSEVLVGHSPLATGASCCMKSTRANRLQHLAPWLIVFSIIPSLRKGNGLVLSRHDGYCGKDQSERK